MNLSACRPSCRSPWLRVAWLASRPAHRPSLPGVRARRRVDSFSLVPQFDQGEARGAGNLSVRFRDRAGSSAQCPAQVVRVFQVFPMDCFHVPTSYYHYTIPLWVNQPQDVGSDSPC